MADLKDDIDKYLKGELTPSEMNALEKKALRDPFLADALEGAEQISPEDLDADLKILQTSLGRRVESKGGKVVSFWVWPMRIAAGLLLMATATFVIISLTKDESTADLALKNQTTSPSSEKDEEATLIAPDSNEKESKELLSEPGAEGDKPKSSPAIASDLLKDKEEISPASQTAREEESKVAEAAPKSDEVQTAAEIIVEERRARAAPVVSDTKTQGALKKTEARRLSAGEDESKQKAAAGAASERSADDAVTNSRVIRGQVKSEDGAAIPGVNVMIKGTNLGTVTDASGNYQISVENQNPNLVFSFIGFTSTELDAGQNDRVDIELSEDISQLSEVVVVGYGSERDSDDLSTLEMAVPAGGRKAFKQYLENNLHYPERALESKVEGKVTVQFTVESTGQLSEFRVLKGIGNGCEEEVIRLIKQGPQWTPTKRNTDSLRDKVKVRMKFELPKK